MDTDYPFRLGVSAFNPSSSRHICRTLVILLQLHSIFSVPLPQHTSVPHFQDMEDVTVPSPVSSTLRVPTITLGASHIATGAPVQDIPLTEVISLVQSIEDAVQRGQFTSAVVLSFPQSGQTDSITIALSTPIASPTTFQISSTPLSQQHEDLVSTVSTTSIPESASPTRIASTSDKLLNTPEPTPTPTTMTIPPSEVSTFSAPIHTTRPLGDDKTSGSSSSSDAPIGIADDEDADKSSYRGLITAASVVLSLLVVSAVIFMFCDNRSLRESLFRRSQKNPSWPFSHEFAEKPFSTRSPSQTSSTDTHATTPDPTPTPIQPPRPAWMKLPSQIAAQALPLVRSSRASFASLVPRKIPRARDSLFRPAPSPLHINTQPHGQLQQKEVAHLKNTVVPVLPDFPRSRWSTTSSDYSPSIDNLLAYVAGDLPQRSVSQPTQTQTQAQMREVQRGEASGVGSANIENGNRDVNRMTGPNPVSLLTPEEFFSLPVSNDGDFDEDEDEDEGNGDGKGHRRRSSAPVFGRNRRVAGLSMASYKARAPSMGLALGGGVGTDMGGVVGRQSVRSVKFVDRGAGEGVGELVSMSVVRRSSEHRKLHSVAHMSGGQWF
ncbi:hypothetical protein D9758_003460 [Tetrapyrgos nigripes]|uniref:Transmembrane protein n=1 Tax=Tetrapyrgos nigripes TaxID=182062 RepID=A0A8H5LW02_9AGAR|nr:hypothetical protein D9758_003460 [Tetrapyrgos nigripes]